MQKQTKSLPIALAALGVVFGDIGTSPLYALRECFHGSHAIDLTRMNVFGVLSLIFWCLVIIISIKYVLFVLRADNKGEGGILALMSLAGPKNMSGKHKSKTLSFVLILGLCGAALLYGDGIITPAISVLSAVEGLKVATPFFEPFIIPITVTILFVFFWVQKKGTARIGKAFGPVILVWFLVLGILGVPSLWKTPDVLFAIDPRYAVRFLQHESWHAFVTLSSIFLVVTGGEALYADMGHFGIEPIKKGWFYVVLPSLLLQYFGQGALFLRNPNAVVSPLFMLAPSWFLYPLVILATAATIIASQAMLTGAFSISQQAVQLGYLPRIRVVHTSAAEIGQIYVPFVNWTILCGTLFLVFEFQSSGSLAAAYGIAVSTTMVITTLLMYVVMRRRWRWRPAYVIPLCLAFLLIDLAFLGANVTKFFDGGWFPICVGIVIFTLMTTWKSGRRILADRLVDQSLPLTDFCKDVVPTIKMRASGTAVFMTANPRGTPTALLQNVRHNQLLHEYMVVLTISTADHPHVPEEERIEVQTIGHNFYRVIARYGFMESPNIPELLKECAKHNLWIDLQNTTFFLGRETLIASERPGMAQWREKIFAIMSRNAQRAPDYFNIPSDQVIEIGSVVEI